MAWALIAVLRAGKLYIILSQLKKLFYEFFNIFTGRRSTDLQPNSIRNPHPANIWRSLCAAPLTTHRSVASSDLFRRLWRVVFLEWPTICAVQPRDTPGPLQDRKQLGNEYIPLSMNR
jgi:hypothetical protein